MRAGRAGDLRCHQTDGARAKHMHIDAGDAAGPAHRPNRDGERLGQRAGFIGEAGRELGAHRSRHVHRLGKGAIHHQAYHRILRTELPVSGQACGTLPAADAVLEADARAGIYSGSGTRRDDDPRTLMAEDQWSFGAGQGVRCGRDDDWPVQVLVDVRATDTAVGDRHGDPAGGWVVRGGPLLHANVVPSVIDGGEHGPLLAQGESAA